jgi:hypothetical protein
LSKALSFSNSAFWKLDLLSSSGVREEAFLFTWACYLFLCPVSQIRTLDDGWAGVNIIVIFNVTHHHQTLTFMSGKTEKPTRKIAVGYVHKFLSIGYFSALRILG